MAQSAYFATGASALILTIAMAVPAHAEQPDAYFLPPAYDNAVFFFGGRMHDGFFGDSFNPAGVTYEDNYVLGGGYQHFYAEWERIALGVEAGAAVRFGEASSLEAWAGGVARFTMFELGPVRVSPSLTFGLSAVTDTIGVESERAERIGGSAPILFYLAPEVNLSLVDQPQAELFWRVQHRSGGFGTIADIDGSNANVLGLRYRF